MARAPALFVLHINQLQGLGHKNKTQVIADEFIDLSRYLRDAGVELGSFETTNEHAAQRHYRLVIWHRWIFDLVYLLHICRMCFSECSLEHVVVVFTGERKK